MFLPFCVIDLMFCVSFLELSLTILMFVPAFFIDLESLLKPLLRALAIFSPVFSNFFIAAVNWLRLLMSLPPMMLPRPVSFFSSDARPLID